MSATTLPLDWAWKTFGTENGVSSYRELIESISKYRARTHPEGENPTIGCIVLTDVFFIDERDWFEAPGNWRGTVTGKSYVPGAEEHASIMDALGLRMRASGVLLGEGRMDVEWNGARYGTSVTRHRLGQGAFRVKVADAYGRRCAISGERTLPVLQAAHIRPYSQEGPHEVSNGLLLRADIHTLFDEGYLTVTPDYKVRVSRRLNADYGNGCIYYAFQGSQLAALPREQLVMPSRDYLEWHNDCVFMG